MYKVEISSQGSTRVFDLQVKPSSVDELRKAINIQSGDLIFPGGKKLKAEDTVPFDASQKVKIRLFGGGGLIPETTAATPSTKVNIDSVHANKSASDGSICNSKDSVGAQRSAEESGPWAIVKGLSVSGETRICVNEDMTYADLKLALVSQSGFEVSDPRGVKLIGKGGKVPNDSDTLSAKADVNLRALRTERGHVEMEKKIELSDIIKRVEEAEKGIMQLNGRLFDPQTAILESRRFRHELEDSISWLQENSTKLSPVSDLVHRAKAALENLNTK